MAARRKRSTKKSSPSRKEGGKRKKGGRTTAGRARAIWKGTISFGSVALPVKLYSAAQDQSMHFRLLDTRTKKPVEQHMIDPESGEVVESGEIRRAIQVSRNKLVIVEKEELEEIAPEASREIEITRFVPPEKITHQWYERPYWLGPDGDAKKYFAVVEALERQGKEGVARWVMRKKEYVGALRVEQDYLMLITLRHAAEVVPVSRLEAPGGREAGAKEMAMARQLIETMYGEFDIAAFRDEYRDRVMALIEAKAKGKVVRFPKAPRRAKDQSLEDVLSRSLKGAEKRRKSA